MDLKSKNERLLVTERLDARIGKDIARAAQILRHGGTVAFPTETVYGLGANALSPEAVAKIFEAKQRPSWDPLIVHICDRKMLAQVASGIVSEYEKSPCFEGAELQSRQQGPECTKSPGVEGPGLQSSQQRADNEKSSGFEGAGLQSRHKGANVRRALAPEGISRAATALMDAFWPGPLTLLLPRTTAIPDAVTAGRPLVGVRMPAHPVALELIRQAGVPIAAPSANTFGHTSPTTADHVLADLDGRIDAVLDGGPTEVGLESTVAGFSDDGLVVFRPGAVTVKMLEDLAGAGSVHVYAGSQDLVDESLASPGLSLRHYAPHAQLILVPVDAEDPKHSLLDAMEESQKLGKTVGTMLPDSWAILPGAYGFSWGPWDDPECLSHRLFAGLRWLDERPVDVIVCPVPEMPGLGEAIRNRLQKASR